MDRLMYSCRRASELASKALEERLPRPDRVRLKLHQLMCGGCRNFSQQITFLRRVSRKLPQALDRNED